MAGLLVSVRSVAEALAAVEGGASVIDVKEPAHGPLGRADAATWHEIRRAVPVEIPLSVALGELSDWSGPVGSAAPGIAYRKLGLAGSGPGWQGRWAEVRRAEGGEARWVAVAYADWQAAGAPEPRSVLREALKVPECAGILVDTWDKSKPSPLEASLDWRDWAALARGGGRFVALAGGLDLAAIARLAPLAPDLFAVRGAACDQSDRLGIVLADRVVDLVRQARATLASPLNRPV